MALTNNRVVINDGAKKKKEETIVTANETLGDALRKQAIASATASQSNASAYTPSTSLTANQKLAQKNIQDDYQPVAKTVDNTAKAAELLKNKKIQDEIQPVAKVVTPVETTTKSTTKTTTNTAQPTLADALSNALKNSPPKQTVLPDMSSPMSNAQSVTDDPTPQIDNYSPIGDSANQGTSYGAWDGGTYGQSLNDALNRILNREPFEYDINADALYQQYKDQYIRNAQLASKDAMGRASAMTGGYGNTYAQSVANQAYNEQMNALDDRIPELYNAAYDRYQAEGTDLRNNLALLQNAYNTEYGEYRDAISDAQYADKMAWQKQQDVIANALNQAKFDESVRQFDVGYDRDVALENLRTENDLRVANAKAANDMSLAQVSGSTSASNPTFNKGALQAFKEGGTLGFDKYVDQIQSQYGDLSEDQIQQMYDYIMSEGAVSGDMGDDTNNWQYINGMFVNTSGKTYDSADAAIKDYTKWLTQQVAKGAMSKAEADNRKGSLKATLTYISNYNLSNRH